MSPSRKLLLLAGLAIALWGMSYGLYYALFDEHQTLETIGSELTASFVHAANGQVDEARAALDAYTAAKFDYVREVDVHSHWAGLALLLILLGLAFDQVAFEERWRFLLAVLLVAGSVVFPLGVFLQTLDTGFIPKAVAVLGAGFLILALGAVAVGFARA